MRQGMQVTSRNLKRQKNALFPRLEPSEGMQPYLHFDFSLVRLNLHF